MGVRSGLVTHPSAPICVRLLRWGAQTVGHTQVTFAPSDPDLLMYKWKLPMLLIRKTSNIMYCSLLHIPLFENMCYINY